MARLAFVPLVLFLLPAPAWAQSSVSFGISLQRALQAEPSAAHRRDFAVGQSGWAEPQNQISITTQIAPNLTAGVGMYGQKRDKGHLAPVTPREFNLPKSRRAGVGVSLKF